MSTNIPTVTSDRSSVSTTLQSSSKQPLPPSPNLTRLYTEQPLDISIRPNLSIDELSCCKITKLEGQNTYADWLRDMKFTAQFFGIWDLYTGERVVVTEPNITDFLERPYGKVERDTSPTREDAIDPERSSRKGTSSSQETTTHPTKINCTGCCEALDLKVAKLKFNDSYRRWVGFMDDERKAFALLRLHVSDPIRQIINNHPTSKLAFEDLSNKYEMGSYEQIQRLYREIKEIHLKDYDNLTHMFGQLDDKVYHRRELGAQYTEHELQAKILRSLTADYDKTLHMMGLIYNQPGDCWPGLDKITNKLLYTEHSFQVSREREERLDRET